MGIASMLGTSIKRREDPRLITGQATYVDDIKLMGMLHMAVLRSPYGHARIQHIDVSTALQAPGVVAVYTAEDLKGKVGNIAVAVPLGHITEGMGCRGPLAEGKVRFYGDPVAIVLAETPYAARDALDLIEVDYEPLPAVVDAEKAMQPDAPILYEDFGTNVAHSVHPPTDEIERVFAETQANGGVLVKARLVNHRVAPVSMETRGVVADFRKADKSLTLWSSSQIPHLLRNILAAQLNLPQHQVRVIVPEVGGGFGSKLNVYPEEALAALASMLLGRPVKWIEDRSENLAVTVHGRDQIDYIEVAATREGKVTGLKVHGISDMGAYCQLFTDVIMLAFGYPVSCGAYDIPTVHLSADIVFTNKAPTDAYRGAGRPEATYVVERAMDLVARELGKDPAEIRLLNFIKPEQFPYKSAAGAVYDSGNYHAALRKAMELIGYEQLRAEQKQQSGDKLLGIGISSYIEICGFGPKGSAPVGLYESARVRVEQSGTVIVYTGASPHGQGEETTFAQIVAEEFSIPVENVLILHGDTDSTPEGRGTYGSRTTAVGGSAVFNAVQKLKEKMLLIASHILEASPDDLTLEDGKFSVKGAPSKAVTFAEVAMTANLSNTLPKGIEPGLETTVFFEPDACVFPFGSHIAVVEIDKETGQVHLKRFVAVDDCGRQLNPMIVQGQIHGGLAQGIGQALYESVEYNDEGQLLTATLMDYAVPAAKDFPPFELDHTVTPTPVNPLGVKGVGEAGTIGSTPAIVAAVADALNVAHVDMPFKPEKIWRIIHQQP
ncbi:carbon-monoxide dehydrogenase large subunit [Thermosporothrix hazakensis]|jgi:carbon-monoxide dehydrogenase large subunit|uniref:Carbon-monoxide dehydrogenase large subunit n=2 Tax=Thermosporothrix TaxID=768650 RepID=A0A326UG65_THEHA|nr:molybdopterin cofactor-binding domain-containing protein [Thermosporothrix hazakensis]PZW35990.1 carbon-monoxide dehydrogenase large subunit [Thermosporothrix hazakensis]BBH88458.1 aldehyde dehydrogenase [Thermosporothrix sp. COM3]GCE46644.1 aldehyde dehydrogenase [Thermosporothrix hazakensis]